MKQLWGYRMKAEIQIAFSALLIYLSFIYIYEGKWEMMILFGLFIILVNLKSILKYFRSGKL